MRVVRLYHAGRDPAHRARDRALAGLGVDLRLVVPSSWPGQADSLHDEPFDVVELDVTRPGDVNRHRARDQAKLRDAVIGWRPDVIDLQEEPVSAVAAQLLSLAGDTPVAMYTAQNIDKRWPPPFASLERRALARVQAMYPCSRQAASVIVGKGYRGHVDVLPLGLEAATFFPGTQLHSADMTIGLVGRLIPEKGLDDAVRLLPGLPGARLVVVGSGPCEADGRELATRLGVDHRVEWHAWLGPQELAARYRQMHIVLVPSRPTTRIAEQFGRVITEAGACGAVPVGFDCGAVREVIGECGLVAEELTAASLLQAVRSLTTDPDRWTRLRRAGIARAAELDWPRVSRRLLHVYESAAGAPAPGRVRARRGDARREWGPPAMTATGSRPFALPVLRDSVLLGRLSERMTSYS